MIVMEAGDILPVAPPISIRPKFQTIEAKPAQESEPGEIRIDAFHLSQGRLVVEQDPESRRWIYTTLDAETGEILSQFPHQFVNNLIASKDFELGMIFDARA
jgi:hypothetical protein